MAKSLSLAFKEESQRRSTLPATPSWQSKPGNLGDVFRNVNAAIDAGVISRNNLSGDVLKSAGIQTGWEGGNLSRSITRLPQAVYDAPWWWKLGLAGLGTYAAIGPGAAGAAAGAGSTSVPIAGVAEAIPGAAGAGATVAGTTGAAAGASSTASKIKDILGIAAMGGSLLGGKSSGYNRVASQTREQARAAAEPTRLLDLLRMFQPQFMALLGPQMMSSMAGARAGLARRGLTGTGFGQATLAGIPGQFGLEAFSQALRQASESQKTQIAALLGLPMPEQSGGRTDFLTSLANLFAGIGAFRQSGQTTSPNKNIPTGQLF